MTANARFTLDDRYISCTLTILNAALSRIAVAVCDFFLQRLSRAENRGKQ